MTECHCDSPGPVCLVPEGTNNVTTSPWLRSRPWPSFSCTEMQTAGIKELIINKQDFKIIVFISETTSDQGRLKLDDLYFFLHPWFKCTWRLTQAGVSGLHWNDFSVSCKCFPVNKHCRHQYSTSLLVPSYIPAAGQKWKGEPEALPAQVGAKHTEIYSFSDLIWVLNLKCTLLPSTPVYHSYQWEEFYYKC